MANKPFILVVLLTLATVAGCSGTMTTQTATAPISAVEIAADVVAEIERSYPPAKTNFKVAHDNGDEFGRALMADLRGKAYGVVETTEYVEDALSLSYKVVRYQEHEILISIEIEGVVLTRLYATSGSPSSSWSRRIINV